MAAEKQSLDELFHAIVEDRFSLDLIGAHDINERNEKGRTLLHVAALYGKTNTIELLLANGASVNLRDKKNLHLYTL